MLCGGRCSKDYPTDAQIIPVLRRKDQFSWPIFASCIFLSKLGYIILYQVNLSNRTRMRMTEVGEPKCFMHRSDT
ncbi:hypothetical protein ZWY2020_007053 [Hordeum vulgare]|nr:hypothetical protein ZWY2020_007053 [Hordeum vulgare]